MEKILFLPPRNIIVKKTHTYNKNTFRFHRWNHAAYSAFMSLGKQITIGRLNTKVVDGLMRNKHLRKLLLTSFITTQRAESDFSDDDSDESPIEQLQQLFIASTITADVYPASQESFLCNNISYFLHNEGNRIFIFYYYEKN